ncbi:MAG: tetratricopeptide repeat protein [Verrucomicrobiota bacterium]
MKPGKPRRQSATRVAGGPGADPGEPGSQGGTGGNRRRWMLRLIVALAGPVVFLGLLEISLRIVGYGYPVDFFIRNPVAGSNGLVENRRFSRRYFPADLVRTPHSLAFVPIKPPRTLRIFVFGESAAEGDPAPAFGFARILQVMLRQHYPGWNIEVINTAVTAINSHVILPIAGEAAGYSGDLWVIYMGNNEVVGPFGSGTIFGAQSPALPLIRANIALKSTRLGQCLDQLLGAPAPARQTREWAGMEMFLKQQVRADDPRMNAVYDHFERNLSDILRLGVRSGARVLVGTVGCNLRDCPPFASLHAARFGDDSRVLWDARWKSGLTLERAGRHAEAAAAFESAAALDDQPAELHFRLGQCFAALGMREEARLEFARARDFDTLRFRVDSRLNQIIRRVSQEWRGRGVWLADTEQALARATADGIPGDELFYEHVHLTFAGNYVVARELAGDITRILPELAPGRGTENRGSDFPSLQECAWRLGLTDSDQLQIALEIAARLNRPPFTQQAGHQEREARWDRALAELRERDRQHLPQTLATYAAAIRSNPEDWQLRDDFAVTLVQHGDAANALAQWREVSRLLPHRLQTYDRMGHVLLESGRPAEAAECYRAALAIDPDFVEGHTGLAQSLLAQNAGVEAVREFQRAIQLQPGWASTHIDLGMALLRLGRPAEAAVELREALRLEPENDRALQLLGKAEGRG